ncbi:MAG: ROK family protein [Acidobacteria bacterium]|nr:ROK family protein [Acidobacteriota bacterium]
MSNALRLVEPRVKAPLDPDFRPAVLANRHFQREIEESGGGVPLVISLERAEGAISRFETRVFPDGHPRAEANLMYAERIFKFLLWQWGGWKAWIGGPRAVGEHIKTAYSPDGARSFDFHFMGEDVYDQPFAVIPCDASEAPPAREQGQPLGRHLEGCRVGFDLGASDRKSSAVVDGEAVYSEEVVWSPGAHTDPDYHYNEILTGLKTAASKMPRLDAIGGSSAGVYVDNKVRIASLFRGIPKENFDRVRSLFPRIQKEMGVPLVMVNDGDVTALAGSMSLEDNGVLGVAMGSSEAAGYVNMEGNLTGWLSELAFAPVDYQPRAAEDEWSKDRGVGARYFSQQCVFRLAPAAGIEIPDDPVLAHKLKFVQEKLEAGHEGARRIWETMGVYLGYAVAHYADFYEVKHMLILGRCTSGRGGPLILDGARTVLQTEFPDLAARLNIQLPDEKSRRVGQSIAAASLPALEGGKR